MSMEFDYKNIIKKAKEIFDIEISGLREVQDKIDENFAKAIVLIMHSDGKIIFCGMGKSGKIAEKIAATMSSVGTPSLFLHPSEAAHGDLGILEQKDILITIGKSGESEEIIHLLPIVKKMGNKIISLVGNVNSRVASLSDIVIDISVSQEACDLRLAPTTSTTASLVLGDALAMVLRELKNFQHKDFALFHPSGQLGKRLLLKVSDLMQTEDNLPVIHQSDNSENLIYLISKFGQGSVCVVDDNFKALGIITDGDLRRALLNFGSDFFKKSLSEIMTKSPLTITKESSAYDALIMMEKNVTISNLPVVESNKYIGMLNLHDLIKAGL
jgi:arabinose-5-phosphate isomerase